MWPGGLTSLPSPAEEESQLIVGTPSAPQKTLKGQRAQAAKDSETRIRRTRSRNGFTPRNGATNQLAYMEGSRSLHRGGIKPPATKPFVDPTHRQEMQPLLEGS